MCDGDDARKGVIIRQGYNIIMLLSLAVMPTHAALVASHHGSSSIVCDSHRRRLRARVVAAEGEPKLEEGGLENFLEKLKPRKYEADAKTG